LSLNRRDFQRLAEAHLKDARALLKARQFDGAYYIAGYAVECALKACICRNTKRFDFPPRDSHRTHYIHNLEGLVKAADIAEKWERDCLADATLAEHWAFVKRLEAREALRVARCPRSQGRRKAGHGYSRRSPRGFEVFIQILVGEHVEMGKRIVEALRKDHFPILGAFWYRMPESGFWRLVIGSKLVDKIGSLEGYKRLHRILERLEAITPFSGSISLFGAHDFRREREDALGPGQFDASPTLGAGSSPFQEAYIYSLKAAGSSR
jgi:HEPN domain-containing protein